MTLNDVIFSMTSAQNVRRVSGDVSRSFFSISNAKNMFAKPEFQRGVTVFYYVALWFLSSEMSNNIDSTVILSQSSVVHPTFVFNPLYMPTTSERHALRN